MGWWDWIGVGERRWNAAPNEQVQPSKTLWDLLQLLIVPMILVGITLWWSAAQDARDESQAAEIRANNERQADQLREDTTLNDYLQRMSDLMLDRALLSSKEGDAVRSVARTLTLTTLPRLDGERKADVVRFLVEAELITEGFGSTKINLRGADLTGANLSNAILDHVNFRGADLAGADLADSVVPQAELSFANLSGVDATYADLAGATLVGANLTGANLTGANLTDANLTDANLTGANLTGANLTGANLTGANLTDAILTGSEARL